MGYFAVQIRMDAGFYKQLPSSHSFVKTYYEYQDDLSGTNSITVALRTTEGDIFNKEYFSKLFELNQTYKIFAWRQSRFNAIFVDTKCKSDACY